MVDSTRVRDRLTAERARTEYRIAALEAEFIDLVDAGTGTNIDDEHDPEGATIAYERAQVSALLHQAQDDLAALDLALERVDNGTAQTCESCGGSIALERLLALPTTRQCIRCAS